MAKPINTTYNEVPQSEWHGVKSSLHLTKEHPGSLHLQAILLAGVSLVNGGSLARVSSLQKQ